MVEAHLGHVFTYIPKKNFDNLPDSKVPGILKEDFSQYLLKWWIRDENVTLSDLIRFTMNLMDPPGKESIKSALKSLYALDFCTGVEKKEDELTELGYFLAQQEYSVDNDIRYTKALYYASWYGCKDEVAVVLSLFSLKTGIVDLFVECKKEKNDKDKKECDKRLSRYRNNYGDMIAAYLAFFSFIEESYNLNDNESKIRKWCQKNYLNYNQMVKIKEKYFELVRKKYPFVLFEENEEKKIKFDNLYDKMSYCLLKGFYINLAEKKGSKYKNLFPPVKTTAAINDIIKISNKKTKNFMKKNSKYIIYNKLQESDRSKEFVDTMAIPEKIVDLLTDFEKEMLDLK